MVRILHRLSGNEMRITGRTGYLDRPLPAPAAPPRPPKLRVRVPRWGENSAFIVAVMDRQDRSYEDEPRHW